MFIVPTVSQLSCRHHKRPEGLGREERQLRQNRRPQRSALHQRLRPLRGGRGIER